MLVTREAPDFTANAVYPDFSIAPLTLSEYRGKYVVLFFYPMDFTFVCPSEIIAFNKKLDEFKKRIENIYTELKQADQDLYTYINNQIKIEREARISTDNQLNQNITRERSERITGDENLEKKIKSISDGILERLAALESGLKDETRYRTEADTDLTIRVKQLENMVNDVFKPKFVQIDTRLGTIESDISVKYGYLNNEIINLKNKISYGSSAPGYLAEGQIYLQYF